MQYLSSKTKVPRKLALHCWVTPWTQCGHPWHPRGGPGDSFWTPGHPRRLSWRSWVAPGSQFGDPWRPRGTPGESFWTPRHPQKLEKVTRELEKVVPGRTLGTPQKKTSKMSPYFCKTFENAETVIKNRGPQKPVKARNGKSVSV